MARKKQDKWESVKKKDSQPTNEDTQRYINKHMTPKMFVEAIKTKGYRATVKGDMPIVEASIKQASKVLKDARDVGYQGSLGINEDIDKEVIGHDD